MCRVVQQFGMVNTTLQNISEMINPSTCIHGRVTVVGALVCVCVSYRWIHFERLVLVCLFTHRFAFVCVRLAVFSVTGKNTFELSELLVSFLIVLAYRIQKMSHNKSNNFCLKSLFFSSYNNLIQFVLCD